MKDNNILDTITDRRMVLHTCCAPCATASAKRLLEADFEVVLFFSNSNIAPEAEFIRRRQQAEKLSKILELPLEIDPYNHASWLSWIKGLEQEPEKGRRCRRCFAFSLRQTAAFTRGIDFPHFTTTLTISPHKISRIIFEAGDAFPEFVPVNFKKQDGFKQSIDFSNEYDLYRQDYCGCEFSQR